MDSYEPNCETHNLRFKNDKVEKFCPFSISKTNLYIRGLDENTTDDDLYEMCKK
jgi:RNA recognition motif-containing protein